VKGNATDALAALRTAQGKANAVAVAEDAGVQIVVDPKRVALREASKTFVQAAVLGNTDNGPIHSPGVEIPEFVEPCSAT